MKHSSPSLPESRESARFNQDTKLSSKDAISSVSKPESLKADGKSSKSLPQIKVRHEDIQRKKRRAILKKKT